ncbi:MAG: DNA-binding protein [Proteobacteria bacterium]|nr:DNA-binding protein [Pseudomonadota bacterium]
MNEYEFTLKFRLPDGSADPEQFIDAIAEAGCDDALVGIGQRGRIALDFSREAEAAHEAIASAVRDVKRAIPGADLVEASPDLVGLTDVAEILGFTRQNMRKLMINNVATFPAAVHEGSLSLWHLATVLKWLGENQRRPIDDSLVEIANANMKLNIAKEARQLPGASLPRELDALFA